MNTDIGINFKNWRKSNKLTTTKIQEVTGVSNSAISAIERGRNLPSLKLLIPLTEHYNLSIDELINNKNNNKLSETENELIELFRQLDTKNQMKELARLELILDDIKLKNKLK